MTVSVEEIDRWDAGDAREVFHATRSRAEAAREAANGIADLPAFGSWGGEASDAAKDAIGRTRQDLDAHGNESLAVAQAAGAAADDIEQIKSRLSQLRDEADRLGMIVDPVTNTVEPGPGAVGADPMEITVKQMQLQPGSYWDSQSNPALENMGAIIAGLPPSQIVTPEGGVAPGS